MLAPVKARIRLSVGALGYLGFEMGFYVCVGSAQSGLEKRIRRHLSRNRQRYWHIDYLLENEGVEVVRVFYRIAGRREDSEIATELASKGPVMEGFGSSDCHCRGHLLKLQDYDFTRGFMHELAV